MDPEDMRDVSLNSVLLAVAAVVVGWILKSLEPILEARRDQRRSLNRALSNLLSEWKSVRSMEETISELSAVASFTHAGEMSVRRNLANQFLELESVEFDETLRVIAGESGVLGYRLHSVMSGRRHLRYISEQAAAATDHEGALMAWKAVTKSLQQALADGALMVARRLGPFTWLAVRRELSVDTRRLPAYEAVVARLRGARLIDPTRDSGD